MSEKFYSAEKNVQVVVSLLKAYGISRIIASPGTTNLTFVASLQCDPFFKIYSAPEERSAAYMAVGMAEESGEPVVITCTGATASRNYLPALTEAFYRKLPVVAITATQPKGIVGQLVPQVIDRSQHIADTNVYNVHIPLAKDRADITFATIAMNEAMHHLRLNGGGPVHINLETSYNPDFSVKGLPSAKKIELYENHDAMPDIPDGRIGVFVGSHSAMSPGLIDAINRFCSRYDAVVFCDHTGNYSGKYAFQYPLVLSQDKWRTPLSSLSLMIYIGEISGAYSHPKSAVTWRVGCDGLIRCPFGIIDAVFKMTELQFFNHYAGKETSSRDEFITQCKRAYNEMVAMIPQNLPFSNIKIAQTLSKLVPENSVFHFGILNSLRSWNFFELPASVNTYCNVGGFGIDGPLSTTIGGALARPDRTHFIALGDLAFFYDMNSLGNRHLPVNLRILLINNGRGTEFTNYNHPAYAFGTDADTFMAAAGHYGNKSPELVRHYAEDLGFEYLKAADEAELKAVACRFMTEKSDRPMLLEVFTDSKDENEALHIVRNLRSDGVSVLESKVRQALGTKGVETIKKLLGK